MRLKFLFFPFMLVLSLLIISMYIWPEIGTIKQEKSALADSTNQLNTIRKNQANIKSVDADLAANSDKADLVMTYLPQAKREEKVVDSLNYLATGAGLSVISIGLDKDFAAAPQASLVAQAVPLTSLSGQAADGSSAAADSSGPVPNSLMINTFSANVNVIGEYEKVLMYVDQIQKINMDNAITKISITPPKADAFGQSTAAPGLLSATLTISFSYAPALKNVSFDNVNFASANFDFTPVNKLHDFVSQGGTQVSMPQIQVGPTGKSNPFLP